MATTAVRAIGPFRNEAIRDFKDPADRASLEAALERAKQRLGARYPLVIDGKKIDTPSKIRSINPAHPAQVIGEVAIGFARTGERSDRDGVPPLCDVERHERTGARGDSVPRRGARSSAPR